MSSYVTIPEGSDKKIGTALINTDEHIQRIAHDSELIEYQKVLDSTNLSGAESFWFDCSGLERIYLKLLFSNSSDTVNVRFGFLDYNNEIVYSDEYTISNSTISDSGSYLSVIKSENVITYQKVKVRLTSAPSSGNVIGYIGGISDGGEVNKGYVFGGYNGSTLADTDEYSNQSDSWASKTDYSSAMVYASAITIQFKGYVVNNTHTAMYVSDIFTEKTTMPSPTRSVSGFSIIFNKGYYICGSDGSYVRTNDEYNPDMWTNKTDAPSPARGYIGSSSILNKAYIYNGAGTGALSDCDEYNPDTWASKTNCTYSAYGVTAATLVNKGYVTGGSNYNKDLKEYNPDTWTTKTNAPSPGKYVPTFTMNQNKLYLFVGRNGNSDYRKDCDEYNPDTWTVKTDAPSPGRYGAAATTI